ncbi:MAG: NAD-dependent dehydratase [Sphingopyxis sp.]|nr:NAD-dependent dehydratase [Sphingopyxis sp.]
MSDPMLVGATGLVGRAVIEHSGGRKLKLLARRDPGDVAAHHARHVAPPEDWAGIIAAECSDTLICCLGTTIRQAGSQAAFRAVDHDLVLAAARAARQGGAQHLIVVSSVGASSGGGNFYLRTKGEVEAELRSLGFARLDILRPGLLTGERNGPPRLGEGLAMVAAPLTNALLHGSLRRYRSIPATKVAKAIMALADRTEPGVYIHENDAIRALAD